MSSFSASAIPALRAQFERDGYLALNGYFSPERIDRALAAIKTLLDTKADQIVVDNLSNGERTYWSDAQGQETRHFKFNDFYLMSDAIREIALDPELSALLRDLLGEAPVLCNSLNFQKGSSQPKHIDSLFMTPRTPHALIATWTAFEDAHPDSGPLVYYPGSHRIPLFRFKDGSHHSTPAELPAWAAYIDSQLKSGGYEEKTFLAKKGDVFIWHSDLVHAGGKINDFNRTRNSLVCHYYGEADCRARQDKLIGLHQGYWMDRPPQPVGRSIPPDQFTAQRPFPEEKYLKRYPDVAAAVKAGGFPSGFAHYKLHGFGEGRLV